MSPRETPRPLARRLVAAALWAAAAALVLPAWRGVSAQVPAPPASSRRPSPPQGLPSFRAGVDVVSLNVTVAGLDGRYLTDLEAADFDVFEDGVRQDLAFFSRDNHPIALSLLLDTSASMDDKMATAQEAAIGFARHLREQDLAELIDFDSRVTVTQGFTNRAADLEAAIRRTSAGGTTSLYNAVYIALKELARVRARNADRLRRQAIVLLSDGEDTSSLIGYEQVTDLTRRSETAIYAIGLRAPKEETEGRGFLESRFVLRDLARQTGGRAFFPDKPEDLAGVYGLISDELSKQYLLGYVPKNGRRDGAWRRVQVRVAREGAAARTRIGYFAPASQ